MLHENCFNIFQRKTSKYTIFEYYFEIIDNLLDCIFYKEINKILVAFFLLPGSGHCFNGISTCDKKKEKIKLKENTKLLC